MISRRTADMQLYSYSFQTFLLRPIVLYYVDNIEQSFKNRETSRRHARFVCSFGKSKLLGYDIGVKTATWRIYICVAGDKAISDPSNFMRSSVFWELSAFRTALAHAVAPVDISWTLGLGHNLDSICLASPRPHKTRLLAFWSMSKCTLVAENISP